MKSVSISQPNQIKIIDNPIPEIHEDEILIKVKFAGICGSDLHIFRGHNPFAKYPVIIGHEFCGEIAAIGENVASHKTGQLVAIDPVLSCGHCYPCSIDRSNVCENLKVLGVHTDGGFTEYIAVPAENAYTIPYSMPEKFAATIEPFSIAANVTSRIQPSPHDVALVYGAGPIGLTCLQVLKKIYHVKTLIAVDRIEERLQRAKTCGADICINNADNNLAEFLEANNIKPTLIIDAACHPKILEEAVEIISPAGKIAIMGFSTELTSLTQKMITGKELTIVASRLNAKKFPEVINWIANQDIDPDLIITHEFHFLDIEQAMSTFENDPKNCCKVLLNF